MLRVIASVAILGAAGVAAVEPAFPGASLEAATKISEAVQGAENSEAYSRLTGGAGAEGGNLQAAVADAKRVMAEQVADNNRLSSLKKAAYIAVHTNLLKSIYVGGCPRDYAASKCPIDWEESGAMCAPTASYSGLCGPQNVGGMGAAQVSYFD